jgi:methionine-rich copper-binding protein CopC
MMSRRLGAGLVASLLLLAAATGAGAHAFLDRAEPRVGGKVHTPPAGVTLWYTERLEPAYSRVKVVDDTGRQVDKADGAVDPGDPRVLRASLAPLAPGTYKVIWRVLSVDTHVTEGDFTFSVAR